jgi:hypothetical protein
VARFVHTNIRVRDIDASLRFYEFQTPQDPED